MDGILPSCADINTFNLSQQVAKRNILSRNHGRCPSTGACKDQLSQAIRISQSLKKEVELRW